MNNKYTMPRKQNVAYAQKNEDLFLYNCMKLARYNVTKEDCQSFKTCDVYDTEEKIAYRNFATAFAYLIRTVKDETNYQYLLDLHTLLMQDLMGDVRNDLTDTQIEELNSIINQMTKSKTEVAIDSMLYILEKKLFVDGDVRVALMFANKIMMQHGNGIITIAPEHDDIFRSFLKKGNADQENFKKWVFQYAIKGVKNDY